MRTTVALLFVLATPAAKAQEMTKLFTDQGKTYLRSPSASALVPGMELHAFSDAAGTRPVGKVVVMEVNGQLARVAFDDDATKGGAKFARIGAGSLGGPPPPPPSSAGGMAPPPPPPPQTAPAGVPPRLPPLRAVLGRNGPAISIRNDSDEELNGCTLKFPDGRYAPAGVVPAHRTTSIGYDKILPPPANGGGDDMVLVRCAEGEVELFFNNPRKNALQARASAAGGGGVVIFNDSNFDWNNCEFVKPNGTIYKLNSMRARTSDSFRAGLFQSQSGAEMITLVCAQGAMNQPVP